MLTYRVSKYSWLKLLARRVGAVVIDFVLGLFVGISLSIVINLASPRGAFTMLEAVQTAVVVFVLLRMMGLSLGNTAVGLRVVGSSVFGNTIRSVALFIPGYNLFDWTYALYDPQHRTFTDTKLGVRVVDDTLQ